MNWAYNPCYFKNIAIVLRSTIFSFTPVFTTPHNKYIPGVISVRNDLNTDIPKLWSLHFELQQPLGNRNLCRCFTKAQLDMIREKQNKLSCSHSMTFLHAPMPFMVPLQFTVTQKFLVLSLFSNIWIATSFVTRNWKANTMQIANQYIFCCRIPIVLYTAHDWLSLVFMHLASNLITQVLARWTV